MDQELIEPFDDENEYQLDMYDREREWLLSTMSHYPDCPFCEIGFLGLNRQNQQVCDTCSQIAKY